MPSSRANAIPTIVHLVRQLKPRSILDVGIGFGKWGHLFREYTDIIEAENDPDRYQRKNWKVRIDGIEGHAAYVTSMHRFLYNEILIGDARVLLPKVSPYDLIFMGDVIEHFEKQAGLKLLADAVEKSRKAVIITTPKDATEQEDLCGNELERHRSLWSAKDFRHFKNSTVKTIDRSILLALIVKPGVPMPACTVPSQPEAKDALRTRRARTELIKRIPLEQPFILVDEEQLRSQLPHKASIPFLERNGQYWGPPEDDKSAIVALELLRVRGAKFI